MVGYFIHRRFYTFTIQTFNYFQWNYSLQYIIFIFACVAARGLRFFLVAYLTYKFGSKFGPFLEKKGGQWAIIITVIIIVIAAAIYFHIF